MEISKKNVSQQEGSEKQEPRYCPVKIDDEKHYGWAALNKFVNSFPKVRDWFSQREDRKRSITIEKTITLCEEEFAFFAEDIRQDASFLQECRSEQFIGQDGTFHCVLVKQPEVQSGFLLCKDEKNGGIFSGYVPNMEWFRHGCEPRRGFMEMEKMAMDYC